MILVKKSIPNHATLVIQDLEISEDSGHCELSKRVKKSFGIINTTWKVTMYLNGTEFSMKNFMAKINFEIPILLISKEQSGQFSGPCERAHFSL